MRDIDAAMYGDGRDKAARQRIDQCVDQTGGGINQKKSIERQVVGACEQ